MKTYPDKFKHLEAPQILHLLIFPLKNSIMLKKIKRFMKSLLYQLNSPKLIYLAKEITVH